MSAGATIAYLRECLQTPELRAFLRVVRAGESHPELDEAYRAMFGWRPGNGQVFTSFDDHPRQAFKSAWGWTSAAGAYQAMCAVPGKVKTDTWGDYVKWCAGQGHVPTFTPAEQDLFGAWCVVIRRRAMPALLARDLEHAIALCNREWASLPGSPYGQPLMSMDKARAVWRTWLARFEAPAVDTSAAPVETAAPDERDAYQAKEDSAAGDPAEYPQEQAPMAPFIAAGLSALIQNAPALIRVFGDSPQAERNAKAAETVAAIAMQATGQPTVEGAVRAIEADPAQAAAYREAVHQSMGELLGLMAQAVDIDEKTRASALDRNLTLGNATGGRWLWLLGGTAGAMVLFSFAITWQVLFGEREFSEGVKMLLLGQIVMAGFGLVMAFMFGTNLQNRVSQQNSREQGP